MPSAQNPAQDQYGVHQSGAHLTGNVGSPYLRTCLICGCPPVDSSMTCPSGACPAVGLELGSLDYYSEVLAWRHRRTGGMP